jgi:hypothetical protein
MPHYRIIKPSFLAALQPCLSAAFCRLRGVLVGRLLVVWLGDRSLYFPQKDFDFIPEVYYI